MLQREALEVLAGLEADRPARRNPGLHASPRVAADAALAGLHLEDPEASQLDPFAFHQGVLHGLEDGEAIVGSDGIHGYKEVPQVGFIEGEITDRSDLDESEVAQRVARVEGKRLFINRGNDGSLRPGDTLAVLAPGAALRDSDTGEDIGTADTEVARATVTTVDARYSEAEVAGDATAVREGMRLRQAMPSPAPSAAPADLPPGPRW